jgi:MYXO-CTERM domain-containing protein
MGPIVFAVVLSSMHYEGDVTAAGGDYVDVPFDVPAGTVEIQITHTDGSDFVILDWGVWGPDGYRGWGGGNTEDAIIGVEQSSRSYLPGPITPGTWTVSVGKAKLDATGGHYSIDVVCRDAATLTVQPKAPFSPVVLKPERRWYKGDFHVHSVQSGDASATFDQIATLAKSRGLDFVNLSDHNTYAQHALIAAYQPSQPDLLFLRGTEITTYSGHGNSVGGHDYIDHRLGYMGRTVAGIVEDVAAEDAAFIVNHPMLDLGDQCIGCQWGHVDDTPWDKVTAMELITGNFDIGVQAFVPRVVALWDSLLDQGFHIAVVGGSDDHRAGMDTGPTASSIGSPTTLVLADNLSEAAIVDALKHGRTIVQLRGPDDPFMDMTIGDAEIGDEIEGIANAKITAHVVGGNGMFVQLWRDGQKVEQKAVSGDDTTVTFTNAPGAQLRRYRLELINDLNQRVVVTSHIYVHGVAEDGCGCRSTRASSGWLIALAALLAGRRRRRRALR